MTEEDHKVSGNSVDKTDGAEAGALENAPAKEPDKQRPTPPPAESVKAASAAQEGGAAEAPARPEAPSAQDLLRDELSDVKIRRAKGSKNITSGIVHILATFNNTRVTFSDQAGNVISWSSAGKCGFRGSRKSTAYAAQVVTQDAGRAAMGHGLREVEIRVKGPGMGRDSAVRAIQSLGMVVVGIVDVTPVPHNGCRPPKRRRV